MGEGEKRAGDVGSILSFCQGHFGLSVKNLTCLQGCFMAGADGNNRSAILGMEVSFDVK